MGEQPRRARRRKVAVASAIATLVAAGSAAAFQQLPSGQQVNNDPAAGIDPAKGVDGGEPTNADVVGGALTAGKPAVPWSVFRQHTTGADQIFSRSFANGAWTTRGNGTVGGKSSGSPTPSGSLNFDRGVDGEAPAIDFAGTGRTVPWATWYEGTSAFGGKNNIFASRFDNVQGDPNFNKWIFSGQSRGNGTESTPVPSLNIHTDQDAENPSVAGGSALDPTKPGPWVTWQETTTLPTAGKDQIFVSKPLGPGQTDCDAVTPAGVPVSGHVPAIGGFCFQQTGLPRVGPGAGDPSLNVDPTRNGIEPDIAFTGANDSVPWVVWYEKDATALSGLQSNEMVFAARGIQDGSAQGGFHWQAVGSQLQGVLDTSGGTHHFGACAESSTAEQQCSLNKNPLVDAEDPRVAAGTMNPANPTVPWVTWDEKLGGIDQIFVSRLVGTGAAAHFELVNNGAPISTGANDSTRPDITFSGNTPYVSWRENIGGGVTKAFVGHFVTPANPTFVLDESDVPLAPTGTGAGQADVREPISSSCTADPFNQDGQACQGGAVGTPFFLFTNQINATTLGLFADAYQPDNPTTGAANGISTSSATLVGAVNPQGANAKVSFDYGTTTAYGQSISAGSTGVSNSATPFSAQLTGLPAGTTIHYRAVATSDFGTFVGGDQSFKTTSPPPPPVNGTASAGKAKVSGTTASLRVSCRGTAGATCRLTLTMTVTEKFRGRKLLAITARRPKLRKVTVTVGRASVTLGAGKSKVVTVSLNGTGKRLLAKHHRLSVTLRVTQALGSNRTATISRQTVSFKAPKKKGHHRH